MRKINLLLLKHTSNVLLNNNFNLKSLINLFLKIDLLPAFAAISDLIPFNDPPIKNSRDIKGF